MLSDYTTYDSVRAVLGVSSRVFPNTAMETEVYALALRVELAQIGPELDQDYIDLIDESVLIVPAAQNFYNAVRLFSAHAVAFKALTALPELSPIYISDSKAALRKDKSEVAAAVTSEYAKYRRHLAAAYAAYLGTAAPDLFQPSLMAVSSPDFDPVTGG
jgi:hypothetical protein